MRWRYQSRGREGKSRLLDELCEVCGYDRKHAIELMRPGGFRRGAPPAGGAAARVRHRRAGGGEGGVAGGRPALRQNLYDHALRGMAIGVAGLSWHGLGLNLGPGCEPIRDRAFKLLGYLRGKGATPCRTLLKNLRLKKAERDQLLERLSYENLVRVEGGEADATTFAEFVEGLHARDEFPPLANHWAEAGGEDADAGQVDG